MTECVLDVAGAILTWPDHDWQLETRSYRDCVAPDCDCPRLPYVCDELRCGNCGSVGVRRFPILATLTEIITGAIVTDHLPA